ncbi:MAG: hypothetical protein ACI8UO_001232 [Verrucomicrobiales bacterium]|jgi:hypothetical protein
MKRLKRRVCLAIVLLIFVSAGLLFYQLNATPRFYSSPTASRDTESYERETLGVFGTWLPTPFSAGSSFSGQSIERPMAKPEHSVEGGHLFINWTEEEVGKKVDLPPHETPALVGDDEVELVAFATWVPGADDPLEPDETWRAPLIFRDPKSLEAFSEPDLDQLGVPPDWRSMPLGEGVGFIFPKLRMLFRARNMPVLRIDTIQGGDAQTDALLVHDPKYFNGDPDWNEVSGDLARVDGTLIAWHDTPVNLEVEVLTGEPSFVQLKREPGEQVVIGDSVRIQFVAEMDNISGIGPGHSTLTNKPGSKLPPAARIEFEKGPATVTPHLLFRSSASFYSTDHLGIVTDQGVSWKWKSEQSEAAYLQWIPVADAGNPDEPLELILLPQSTVLKFELAGMPDLPNPRSIENLFDAKLTRVTLRYVDMEPADSEHLIWAFIGLGAQVAWSDDEALWEREVPASLPDDLTFRNTTPQQLLDWYLRETPGATVSYDEKERLLKFNEPPETWWSRTKGWWKGKAPKWLGGDPS